MDRIALNRLRVTLIGPYGVGEGLGKLKEGGLWPLLWQHSLASPTPTLSMN